MLLIEAENISLIKNKNLILDNISLEIKSRDFTTIIGPNGAGKTMLLQILMGFFMPNKGKIIRTDNLKIGYMPQKFITDQIMPISAKRFLTLHKKKYDNLFLEKIINETAIENFINQPLALLSGGELQKLLLARALLDLPQLLILDEPAQNLDISSQLNFYSLLEKIYKKYDIAILIVSHDLHLVMSCTKKVICLFGHICCSGEPQAIARDQKFINLFGNDMAKMMAIYQHHHNHNHEHNHDNK